MFYDVKDVMISELKILYTLGYAITGINMMGRVSLSSIHIENTTFENDPECTDYAYDGSWVTFNCSGSGFVFIYLESNLSLTYNTSLYIDQNVFKSNSNALPVEELKILTELIQSSVYKVPIPVQDASSIAIFYLQSSFDVETIISDSLFLNNSGTLSGAIAVSSVSTNRGTTNITNGTFYKNKGKKIFLNGNDQYSNVRGGYLIIRNASYMSVTTLKNLPSGSVVLVKHLEKPYT